MLRALYKSLAEKGEGDHSGKKAIAEVSESLGHSLQWRLWRGVASF